MRCTHECSSPNHHLSDAVSATGYRRRYRNQVWWCRLAFLSGHCADIAKVRDMCKKGLPDWRCSVLRSLDWNPAMDTKKKKARIQYSTFHDDRQNHGAALMCVAETARMASVTYHNETYAVKKIRAFVEHSEEGEKAKGRIGLLSPRTVFVAEG